jgi:adenylyltransferase/sulfurtransferase
MPDPHDSPPLEIHCQELKALLDRGVDLLLVDCREKDEYEVVRIEQATLLPMSEIGNRLDELMPHQHRHVVVHCHHGVRSLRVTHWLRDNGFAQAQSLAGGIDQWAAEIDPSLPRY